MIGLDGLYAYPNPNASGADSVKYMNTSPINVVKNAVGLTLGGLRLSLPMNLHNRFIDDMKAIMRESFNQAFDNTLSEKGFLKIAATTQHSFIDRILDRRYVSISALREDDMRHFFNHTLSTVQLNSEHEISRSISALSTLVSFLEFQIKGGCFDIEKGKLLNNLQEVNLDVCKTNPHPLDKAYTYIYESLSNQNHFAEISSLQRITIQTTIAMLKAHRESLCPSFLSSHLDASVKSIDWCELDILSAEINKLPKYHKKNGESVLYADLKRVFSQFIDQAQFTALIEGLEPYMAIVTRIHFIHNIPFDYVNKDQYHAKVKMHLKYPYHDDFFDVFLKMENAEYRTDLNNVRNENNLTPCNYQDMKYLYQDKVFKENLYCMAEMLDWRVYAEGLYSEFYNTHPCVT